MREEGMDRWPQDVVLLASLSGLRSWCVKHGYPTDRFDVISDAAESVVRKSDEYQLEVDRLRSCVMAMVSYYDDQDGGPLPDNFTSHWLDTARMRLGIHLEDKENKR